MNKSNTTSFAPQLYIPHTVTDISFYERVFGAIELRRLSNDDGSIRVSECIDGCLFHLHEENHTKGQFKPDHMEGTLVI